MVSNGIRDNRGPSSAIMANSVRVAAPLPTSAPRQPRTTPTASTTVRASTNSTSEARKAAATVGPMWVQLVNICSWELKGRVRHRKIDNSPGAAKFRSEPESSFDGGNSYLSVDGLQLHHA